MGFGNKIGDWIYEITDPIEKAFKFMGQILAKIVNRLFLPVFFGAIAFFVYPGDISEIPFAQLTLKDIGGLVASACSIFIAIRFLFNSRE